jgi:hypothetical protein
MIRSRSVLDGHWRPGDICVPAIGHSKSELRDCLLGERCVHFVPESGLNKLVLTFIWPERIETRAYDPAE